MPEGRCTLEIFVNGGWTTAATVRVEDTARGISSPSTFEYDFDYLDAIEGAFEARDARAVSCRYPLNYEDHAEATWPAFLLDLVPAGAARRHWEARQQLPDNSTSDWPVLVRGAGNPPGNVRVAEAVEVPAAGEHPGFERDEVIRRGEDFIEYARASGAPVSGSTGAGGDSPKFLLREDLAGRWHADGALPDDRTRRCWIVKYPRNRGDVGDRLVLEAEAGYHGIAKRIGVRTHGRVEWQDDCLFVERFDRIVTPGGIERLGLESLYSLAGVAEFGASMRKERMAAAIAQFATDPASELREFLLRDVLDVAMGNTDNHGRNTSVIKHADGKIALSPLYDFAPMMLDRSGIARVCRWQHEDAGYPEWRNVLTYLGELGLAPGPTRVWLRDLAEAVLALPVTMSDLGVPAAVINACKPRIHRVGDALAALPA
jgi:serine/threonine-protein kinase HipA